MSYKTLTQMEYNLLNKIARKTKSDYWFNIEQDKNDEDYIHDLEKDKRLSLDEGVVQLLKAIDCKETYASCDLTSEEENAFKLLIEKLDLGLFYNDTFGG